MKDEKLIDEYGKHKDNMLYQSVMDIIVNANKEKFEEEGHMCEALMEIAREKLKDEFEANEKRGREAGMQAGMEAGLQAGLDMAKKIFKLYNEGKTEAEIVEYCGIDEEKVREILE